ncbi:sensor histidine kinase [Enterobacteriaceae bacterium LUAb1]
MRRFYVFLSVLLLTFSLSISIAIVKFNNLKEQYSHIEPNLDNYSVAEIIFLSFERMRNSLLSQQTIDEYLIKKKIFDSKIAILENKSNTKKAFFYDSRFIAELTKLKKENKILDLIYQKHEGRKDTQERILNQLKLMEYTLLDLQERIYEIQIKKFSYTQRIIQDSTGDTEKLALLCISLIFFIFLLLWLNMLRLKITLKNKNIFISAIYHELSSSIQSILIAADILSQDVVIKKNQNILNKILFHSSKLLNQTKEILEYSRIEIGKADVKNVLFNIQKLTDEVLFSINIKNDNNIIIRKNLESINIFSDKQKVFSILNNLIENANKNTYRGKIIVSLKILQGKLYMCVADNGDGFDIKTIKNLYKPFNQGAEKNTRQGLGLGLTIIKEYTKQLNGKIRVRSIRGQGSIFIVCIPVSHIQD